MRLLHPEVDIIPGRPGHRPPVSPVPDKQAVPGSAVLRLSNTTQQENAYTVRLISDAPFWQEDWYTVTSIPLPVQAANSTSAGTKADQRGPLDRWVKIYVPRGGSRDVLVRFNVPQTPEARAARYPYIIEIETKVVGPGEGARRGERVHELEATAIIRPYFRWSVDLNPEQPRVSMTRRSANAELIVTNEGNDWLYCDIQLPRSKDLSVHLHTMRVAVPPPEPGETISSSDSQQERLGVQRTVPLRGTTKLRIIRGLVTPQPIAISAIRVDAPSVPPPADDAGYVGAGTVVANQTNESQALKTDRALAYSPPVPAKLTDVFSHGAGSLRSLILTFIALVVALHLGVLLYERMAHQNIGIDTNVQQANAGDHLIVTGRFLKGSVISMGDDKTGNITVTADPTEESKGVDTREADLGIDKAMNGRDVLTVVVPKQLDGNLVHLTAHRVVSWLPLLTPFLPSAVSPNAIQIGKVTTPTITQLVAGQFKVGDQIRVGITGFTDPGEVTLNGIATVAAWSSDHVSFDVQPGSSGQQTAVQIKVGGQTLDAGGYTLIAPPVAPTPGAPASGGAQGSAPMGGQPGQPAASGQGSASGKPAAPAQEPAPGKTVPQPGQSQTKPAPASQPAPGSPVPPSQKAAPLISPVTPPSAPPIRPTSAPPRTPHSKGVSFAIPVMPKLAPAQPLPPQLPLPKPEPARIVPPQPVALTSVDYAMRGDFSTVSSWVGKNPTTGMGKAVAAYADLMNGDAVDAVVLASAVRPSDADAYTLAHVVYCDAMIKPASEADDFYKGQDNPSVLVDLIIARLYADESNMTKAAKSIESALHDAHGDRAKSAAVYAAYAMILHLHNVAASDVLRNLNAAVQLDPSITASANYKAAGGG